MSITTFSFPATIHFGPGARKQLAAHLLQAGFKRHLIVTDMALATLPILIEFRAIQGRLVNALSAP